MNYPELEQMAQLETKVQTRMGGRVRDLRLAFHERGLVLRGMARTYYAKQLAQHAAMEVSGLPIVANEIEVSCRTANVPVMSEP